MHKPFLLLLLFCLALSGCGAADDAARNAEEIARLTGLVDDALRLANHYDEEAAAALRNGDFDQWLKYSRLASDEAARFAASMKEARRLAGLIPEERLPAAYSQVVSRPVFHSLLFKARLRGAAAAAAEELANIQSNELYRLGKDQLVQLTTGYLCLHIASEAQYRRPPTAQELEDFAWLYRVSFADSILHLEGYADQFYGLAKEYSSASEPVALRQFQQDANEICQEFFDAWERLKKY